MVKSYYQLQLSEEDQDLTTFLNLMGRFKYTVLPMGLSPSSDHLNMKTEHLVKNSQGTHKNMDDLLQEATSIDQLYDRLVLLCEKAWKDNVKFSRLKFMIGT